MAVDSFIDDLKTKKNSGFSTSAQIKTATEIRELKLRVSVSTTNVHQSSHGSISFRGHRSLLCLDILWSNRVSPCDLFFLYWFCQQSHHSHGTLNYYIFTFVIFSNYPYLNWILCPLLPQLMLYRSIIY